MTDVTLLLTIYNRRKFTLRWIDFIKTFNCPYKVYICDGGNDGYLERKLQNISKKDKKITYKKFKYYKNYKNFYEKFYKATKYIKTKYIYICEDDDFLIFENIKKSEKFLNENKKYTCSGGQSYNLELINNSFVFSRLEHLYNISFRDESKFKRIIKVIGKMQSNYNCLHRTENLTKIFKLLNQVSFKNIYESELLFVLTSFFYGKINRFNHIEYIKVDNIKHSSSSNFLKSKDYLGIISSKEFSYENYSFLYFFKKYFKNSEIEKIENKLSNFLENINRYRLKQIYPDPFQKTKNYISNFLKQILIKTNLFWIIKKTIIRINNIQVGELNFYTDTIRANILSKKNILFFKNLLIFLKKS